MKNLQFWAKVSRVSTVLGAIFLLVTFFDDGIENIYYYYFVQISLSMLILTSIASTIIEYFLKRK